MDNFDPFKRFVGTPEGPASAIFAITPSDTTALPRGVKTLRIYNSSDTIAFVCVIPIKGDGAPTNPDMTGVSLPIPPLTLVWEDIRVSYVLATGTDSDALTLHGYTS